MRKIINHIKAVNWTSKEFSQTDDLLEEIALIPHTTPDKDFETFLRDMLIRIGND